MRGGAKGGSEPELGMGALGPFVTILRILEPPQQLIRQWHSLAVTCC